MYSLKYYYYYTTTTTITTTNITIIIAYILVMANERALLSPVDMHIVPQLFRVNNKR